MENSLVQQLKESQLHNFTIKPSLINTHFNTDLSEGNLPNKSRIINLPNHKKENLSGKLDLIVVFQAIEIERLSEEVETLRIKGKAVQRQLSNFENHGVQIMELTERCYSLEQNKYGLELELQKADKLCQDFYNQLEVMRQRYANIDASLQAKYELERNRVQELLQEVERWRQRHASQESAHLKQMESLRETMNSQRKSAMSRQISQLTVKYEAEINSFQLQLKRSREQTNSKINEISHLKHELSRVQAKYEEALTEFNKINEIEEQVNRLSQENNRLIEQYRGKAEECDRLRYNIQELTKELETSKTSEHENKMLQNKLETAEAEIKQWTIQCAHFEDHFQRLEAEAEKAKEYEMLMDKFSHEIEQANLVIQEKINELERQKRENQRLNQALKDLKADMQQAICDEREKQTKKQTAILQEKFDISQRIKLQEIESLRSRLQDADQKLKNIQLLEEEKNRLAEEISEHVFNFNIMSNKIQNLEDHVAKMDEISRKLDEEMRTKQKILDEHSRLNDHVRDLNGDLDTVKAKNKFLSDSVKEYENIYSKYGELENKISQMTVWIDQLQDQINEKIKELNELTRRYHVLSEKQTSYESLEEKLSEHLNRTMKLHEELDRAQKTIQKSENTRMQCESQISELRMHLANTSDEKDSLMRMIDQKNDEVSQINKDLFNLGAQARKAQDAEESKSRELSLKTNEFAKRENQLSIKINDLDRRIADANAKVNEHCSKNRDYEDKISSLREELKQSRIPDELFVQIKNLKEIAAEQENVIRSLHQKIGAHQSQVSEVRRHINQTHNTSLQYGQSLSRMNNYVDSMSSMISMIEKYSSQNARLTEENMILDGKLNIVMTEINYIKTKRQDSKDPLFDDLVPVSMKPLPSEVDSIKQFDYYDSIRPAINSAASKAQAGGTFGQGNAVSNLKSSTTNIKNSAVGINYMDTPPTGNSISGSGSLSTLNGLGNFQKDPQRDIQTINISAMNQKYSPQHANGPSSQRSQTKMSTATEGKGLPSQLPTQLPQSNLHPSVQTGYSRSTSPNGLVNYINGPNSPTSSYKTASIGTFQDNRVYDNYYSPTSGSQIYAASQVFPVSMTPHSAQNLNSAYPYASNASGDAYSEERARMSSFNGGNYYQDQSLQQTPQQPPVMSRLHNRVASDSPFRATNQKQEYFQQQETGYSYDDPKKKEQVVSPGKTGIAVTKMTKISIGAERNKKK